LERILVNCALAKYLYGRSSPLTRGGCLAAYARSIAVRAGFVVPAGQRGNAGQPSEVINIRILLPKAIVTT